MHDAVLAAVHCSPSRQEEFEWSLFWHNRMMAEQARAARRPAEEDDDIVFVGETWEPKIMLPTVGTFTELKKERADA